MPDALNATSGGAAAIEKGELRNPSGFLGVLLLAFAPTIAAFPSVWLDNRTHGFLAAGLAVALLWRDRQLIHANGSPTPAMLWAIACCSLMWLVATVTSTQVVQLMAIPALLWCWLVALNGERSGRRVLPALLAFSLALPVWEILTWPLQIAAAEVSGMVVGWFGVSAVINREVIAIPWGKLIVADSCSGLGFFLTAVTLGACYALLVGRSRRPERQWAIVASAGAMAILANWVRVIGLVLIADATRMQSPLMAEHELFGWVIFAVSMAAWFVIAGRLDRDDAGSDPEAQLERSPVTAPQVALKPRGSRVLVLATMIALLGPALYWGVRLIPSDPPVVLERNGFVAAAPFEPITVTDSAPAAPAGTWAPTFRNAATTRTLHWRSGIDTVRVDRIVYDRERQGEELVGGGNKVAADSVMLEERVIGPLDSDFRRVRQTVVREGGRARIIWYWYRVAEVETASNAKAKFLSLVGFFRRREGGEVTLISTACNGGDCRAATSRLFQFVTGRNAPVDSSNVSTTGSDAVRSGD